MNRRRLIASALGLAAGGAAARGAAAQPLADLTVTAAIRGSIDASEFGVWPDALDDQSRAFRRMLEKAAGRDAPVFLPPGRYVVSNIRLPRNVRLAGVPGATRIVYGGDGYLFAAEDAATVELSGLAFDGANRPLGAEAQGLIEMRRVGSFVMDRCEVTGSGGSGVALERVSGRIERTTISGAAAYGLYCVEAGRMHIAANHVRDCAEGGILVHRWRQGADGTLVTGNCVERIGAKSGGTGQYGNGVNIFRAGNVIVSNNHISDCAFSAVRANSADNVQILGNQCLRSGETAIYSEFAFEGAVIASNLIDGAANGISIANLDHGGRLAACTGNVVRNLIDRPPYEPYAPDVTAAFGIGISAEADAALTGNIVEGAPRHGFLIGWGPFLRNVAATGNVVRGAREGFAVSVVEGAGSVMIADNVIDGAERAIVGYRWLDAATGELAEGEGGSFRHLRIEKNLVS
jgi:uncharacterized secreted repeat protein (TIGR03808 family)